MRAADARERARLTQMLGSIRKTTNGPREIDLAERREGLKLFFDVFKHLTTLSSSSIVVLVTFLGKTPQQPRWRLLIAVSLLGFLVSIVGSVIVMLSTARTIRRSELTDQLPDKLGNLAYLVAVSGFAVGLFSLALFGIKNL